MKAICVFIFLALFLVACTDVRTVTIEEYDAPEVPTQQTTDQGETTVVEETEEEVESIVDQEESEKSFTPDNPPFMILVSEESPISDVILAGSIVLDLQGDISSSLRKTYFPNPSVSGTFKDVEGTSIAGSYIVLLFEATAVILDGKQASDGFLQEIQNALSGNNVGFTVVQTTEAQAFASFFS